MRPLESFVAQPVRSLQTMLRTIAEDQGRKSSLIPDGVYGNQTMSEVSGFQRRKGLPVTGVADQATWEAIADEFTPARTRVTAAEPIEIVLNPNQVIQKNESHPIIFLTQGILIVLSDVYASITEPNISGILDLPTSNSIESFQSLSLLPVTGELDKITWKHLALHYPLAANLKNNRKFVR